MMFLQASKISAAGADWWLETQISTATDRKVNLTWTLYIPSGSSLLANQQASLSSDTGNTKGNTEVTKKGKGHVYRNIRFSNFISHRTTFSKLKMPIYSNKLLTKKIRYLPQH